MTPLGTPIDLNQIFHYKSIGAEHVDKNMLNQDLSLVTSETILRARVAASKALAIILSLWPVSEQQEGFRILLEFYIFSASMLQPFFTATIVHEWAAEANALSPISQPILSPRSVHGSPLLHIPPDRTSNSLLRDVHRPFANLDRMPGPRESILYRCEGSFGQITHSLPRMIEISGKRSVYHRYCHEYGDESVRRAQGFDTSSKEEGTPWARGEEQESPVKHPAIP